SPYIPIAIFVVVATGFALFTLVFSGLLHPEKYNKVKLEPYECGIEPLTDARDRYSIRYYLVAMLFVIFDVETVFMFPWAVIFDKLLLFGLIEMLVFIFILAGGSGAAGGQGAAGVHHDPAARGAGQRVARQLLPRRLDDCRPGGAPRRDGASSPRRRGCRLRFLLRRDGHRLAAACRGALRR